MIQKTSFIMNCLALLTSVVFVGLMTGCKDSEEVIEPDNITEDPITLPDEDPGEESRGLLGKWELAEVKDGPYGTNWESRRKGGLTVEFQKSGKVIFSYYEYGTTETMDYYYPENQDIYGSPNPIIIIGEAPLAVEVGGYYLKLTYRGLATADHVPATFVLKRKWDREPLLILSDDGQRGTGEVYRTSCIKHKELRVERNGTKHMLYHLSFNCNIRKSPVFDGLDIDFETDTEMTFDDLKVGDTFDTEQFRAFADYTPTWMEDIGRGTRALSGQLTVANRRKVEDTSFITLELKDIKFEAIDKSCIYSVSGALEYELP